MDKEKHNQQEKFIKDQHENQPKERLVVKNFFSLKDIDIELARFNVFIGEQASGKSLLMKLVYFFRSILCLPIIGYQIDHDQISKHIYEQFSQIFRISNIDRNFKVDYLFNQQFKITIDSIDHQIRITYSEYLEQIYECSRANLTKIYSQLPEQFRDGFTMKVNISHELSNQKLPVDRPELFIPGGRTFLVALQTNIFALLDQNTLNKDGLVLDSLFTSFAQKYQLAWKEFGMDSVGLPEHTQRRWEQFQLIHQQPWFEDKSKDILKGRYVYDDLGGFIQQSSGDVRPWNASTGQQEFLPIYLTLHNILYKNRAIPWGGLYIEEPEAHLYPSAQKDILELLVFTANIIKSDSLCIATHSPYILTVLNNLMIANDVKEKQTDFNSELLVNFDEVRAYMINGSQKNLMDSEYRIIDADQLDEVSETISNEFSKMVELL